MATKKRLIDANKLKKKRKYIFDTEGLPFPKSEWFIKLSDVLSAPTVDAVEVVRCKDCKHMKMTPDSLRWCNVWNGINGLGDEGFCNYGERKDNG